MVPIRCFHGCECNYNPLVKHNVYNCTDKNITSLPHTLEKGTTWFQMNHVNLSMLCGTYDYLSTLSVLNLKFCNISTLCEDFFPKHSNRFMTLDLRNNSITKLPSKIAAWKGGSVLISGNPYHCTVMDGSLDD